MGPSFNVVGLGKEQQNREVVIERGKGEGGIEGEQVSKAVLHGNDKEVNVDFGYQGVDSSNKKGGSSSKECREDLEGEGGWTLVTTKKSKPSKPKTGGKPKGIPGAGRRLHGGGENGKGKGGDLGLDSPLLKPMLVYKRFGTSLSGKGKFSASKSMRQLEEVVGIHGIKPVNVKRPKGRFVEVEGSYGGAVESVVGGELGEVTGGKEVVYSPVAPSSPNKVGMMKRRKGGKEITSGGDASPSVVQ